MMDTSSLAVVILAAGSGTRMRSSLPKVLHQIGDMPLICHVVERACALGSGQIVVVVQPKDQERIASILTQWFPQQPIDFALQTQPKGTGDGARVGLEQIHPKMKQVMILYGDVPLVQLSTLQQVLAVQTSQCLSILTAKPHDPRGYGRIVRDQAGKIVGIVEQKDATVAQQAIGEINAGIYVGQRAWLQQVLPLLQPNNAQGEYYLTDIVAKAAMEEGERGEIGFCTIEDANELLGINSRVELAAAELRLQQQLRRKWLEAGVTMRQPDSVWLSCRTQLAPDVLLGPGVQLRGQVQLASGCIVEGPSILKDTTIGANSRVESFSHIEQAVVAEEVTVGPFARLRPGSHLEHQSHVGNFVELKQTRLGAGSKANHLSYLGDTQVGERSNIGAGTITCNYDGVSKHKTQIGNGCFVGSHATLVAPVHLQDESFVAAASVVTEDVPQGALAVARSRQINKEGYAKQLRERLAAAKKGKS